MARAIRLPRFLRRLRPPNLSLRTKIVGAFTFLTLTLIVLVAVAALAITERNLFAAKVQEARLVVDSFNAMIPVLLEAETGPFRGLAGSPVPAAARRMCNRLGLGEFVLVDRRMQIIAAANETLVGRRLEDERVVEALTTERTVHRFESSEGQAMLTNLEVTGPVFYEGRVQGALRFSLPTSDVWRMVNLTRSLVLFYVFLDTVLIIGLGSYVLYRLLVRPIRELGMAIQRVGEEGHEASIPRGRSDEIGQLGHAFAEMVKNLRGAQERQQRQMRSLERSNEDLERAQKELLSTDRLAYVGRVAAGVAHEVGNPLAAIFGYLEILKDAVPDEETRGFVVRIEKEAGRIDDIIRSLLDFAKPAGEGVHPVSADEVVRDAVAIVCKQRAMDRMNLETNFAAGPPVVRADSKLLMQVLVNLLINARDATPAGGTIRVTTGILKFERMAESLPTGVRPDPAGAGSLHELIDGRVRFSGKIPFRDGRRVVKITVDDVGEGISEQNLRSVFEPFFTTKAQKGGTGLGLAICQRIVDSFGGVIKVDTRSGEGTCFSIYLPVAEDEGELPEAGGADA